MERFRLLLVAAALSLAIALSACASQTVAAQAVARPSGATSMQPIANVYAPAANGKVQGKGPKDGNDKGNKGATASGAFGAWWKNFRARFLSGAKQGGWQLGRFKDAFPFAHPNGWQAAERGDAMVMAGPWQGGDYVFQITRTVQVQARTLQDWVSSDLQKLGINSSYVRYAQAGNVQIAAVTGIKDPDYACPVAYVFLWTANPAGRNQRQALGVVSQTSGSACNPAALNTFVDEYLAQIGGTARVAPSPSARATTRPPTSAPTTTPTPAPTAIGGSEGGGWQQSRFFNAFSFAYPQGWSMDRLGDTAHLQGAYQGQNYVADMVWVRGAPQVGLEQWARADLSDLGVNLDGLRLDYTSQGNDAQIAIASGVRIQGYQCPALRMYVLAKNAAAGGQRAYTVTAAQANGQTCNPQALEDLAYKMVQPSS